MIYDSVYNGTYVNIRNINTNDAEFTLNIRNEDKITKYVSKLTHSIEVQKQWIDRINSSLDSYFFISLNKNNIPIGTVSIINIDKEKKTFEPGSWVSIGNSVENLEPMFFLMDFAFYKLNLDKAIIHIVKTNLKVISFWKRMGAVYVKESTLNGFECYEYYLDKTIFNKNCLPYKKFMNLI